MESVAVTILEREYRLSCAPHERESLLRAALELDHRMRELKQANKSLTMERIAVLAALMLSHEQVQSAHGDSQASIRIDTELKRLNARLDAVLSGA
jgi:cell division protein ZapA